MQQGSTLGTDAASLEAQIKNSIQVLLNTPSIPERIRRDLQQVANITSAATQGELPIEKVQRLLHIYDITIKILRTNHSNISQAPDGDKASNEQIARLNNALQNMITELDFDGEYGEQLMDIRTKLLLGVRGDDLVELTLDVLKLVALGTEQEREMSQQFLEQSYDFISRISINTEQISDKSRDHFIQRQEMNRRFNSLVTDKYRDLADEPDTTKLREQVATMMHDLKQLSDRYQAAEQRERVLLEQVSYAKRQIDNLNDSTKEHRRRIDEQNERLRRDPLTKIYNRTAFIEQLESEYRHWIRNQHPLRIALFDIDNFSYVNNNFGYTAGDKALKIISRAINRDIKCSDIFARFSGEEFILLLPTRSDKQAKELIEAIQARVATLPFKFRNHNLKITLSVASKAFSQGDTPEGILEELSNQLITQHTVTPSQLVWL